MSKFQELDDKIVAEVRSGAKEFGQLAGRLRDEAAKHLPHRWASEDRVIDRRLQALKKAGKIEHAKGGIGWRIVEPRP